MRSVLYRFPDLQQFEQIVCSPEEGDLELGLPAGEVVADGEWVLAIFELGENRRATSAAACASVSPEGARLTFEPRDWRRLAHFAQTEATRPGSIPDADAAALPPAAGEARTVFASTFELRNGCAAAKSAARFGARGGTGNS